MPTPARASTQRSSLEESPLDGADVTPSIPVEHAASPGTSYISMSQASGPSRSHRGIPVYTPRSSRSYMSVNFPGRSRNSAPGSWTRSSSTDRSLSGRTTPRSNPAPMDNWQGLHDILADESEDDAETVHGEESGWTGGLGRETSSRSLRSFFFLPPESTRRIPVSRTGTQSELDARSIDGVLSMSPPQMDGLSGPPAAIPERPSEDDAEDEREDTHRAGGAKAPLMGDPPPPRNPNSIGGSTTLAQQPGILSWLLRPSPVFIAILKCAITYLIASLFTFVPQLARLLSTTSEVDAHGRVTPRPAYSAHMVATIVVYFNPAKTIGNMFLATRFCIVLATLATMVSLMSMLTLAFFDHFSPSQGSKWDWISELGDWMVCVLWIGGSMGLLAWLKVWVNNPSFNSGCSMAAVTIYTVVIKEGAVPKLLEVLLIVFIGAVITNLTCYLVFPSSATTRLETSITRSLKSFSALLDLLAMTFLLQRGSVKDNQVSLKEAITSHALALNTLQTDLAEAKNERIIDPRIRGRKLELFDALIGSLTRLAQHLAGLRGSIRLQEGLIRASREGRLRLDLTEGRTTRTDLSVSALDNPGSPGPGPLQDLDVKESVDLFLKFRDMAGSEMDVLVDHCQDALDAVQSISKRRTQTSEGITEIRNQLASSLRTFSNCSSRAIKRLYAGPRRQKGVYEDSDTSEAEEEGQRTPTDAMEDKGLEGPNETVFLIYFFLFTLEEFSRELLFLLDMFSQILNAEQMPAMQYIKSLWPSKRGKKEKRTEYLYKQFRSVVPIDPSQLQPPLFPRGSKDTRTSLATDMPGRLDVWSKAKQRFWTFGDWLRRPNVRYAIKTGLGGAILAAPAYTEVGRPIFLEYRGEWALIAYFSAISPTVGQTNFLSFFRVVGTLIGAAVAVLFSILFPENPIVLPILGVIFSLPCFYVITQMPNYAQAGRFTLLTYNLTCLYAYNSREREISAFSIAYHRSTSVIIGVIWAAVVSRYWWPFTARRELRMGLSDFCLDLSYLYSRLVATYSKGLNPVAPEQNLRDIQAEQEPLLPVTSTWHPHLNPGVRQFMAMELHLQSQLGSFRSLLAQTKNEPRLRGPFAFEFYQEVLLSCERMLDRLHSMRCVTTRDEWDNVGFQLHAGLDSSQQGIRESFVIPVNKQRREMAGNVILYFYTLSAGFRLRTPMPPYLPPAEQARQTLVKAIRNLDVVKRRSVRGGGRHLLFFAYALAMQEVIAELDYLGELMQDEFGVISQSTRGDFEELFQTPRALLETPLGTV